MNGDGPHGHGNSLGMMTNEENNDGGSESRK